MPKAPSVILAVTLAVAGCAADGGRDQALRTAGSGTRTAATPVTSPARCPGKAPAGSRGVATTSRSCARPTTDAAEIVRAERDPDLPLAPARATVQRACQRAGIACPTLLPLSSERGPRVADFSARRALLLNVVDPAALVAPSGRPFGAAHLLLGQSEEELPLGGTPGGRWPPRGLSADTSASIGDLRIVSREVTVPIRGGGRFVQARPPTIIRRATVHTRPALVLRAEPYPQGGVHGGHILVIWNAGGHGHLVSLHYDGAPLETRVQAALAMAASEVPAVTAPRRPPTPGRTTLTSPGRLARAILEQTGPPRPTSASCQAPTAAERRREPFGHTRLPLLHCLVRLRHRQGGFIVQVLPNGCFIAVRQPPGQAIYGCGAGGLSTRP